MMKILLLFLVACVAWPITLPAQSFAGDTFTVAQRQKNFPKKKQRKRTPVTPGSEVIMLKDKRKAEIRPDGTVWWFGSNQKKALMADGTYTLQDSRTLTTKDGKMVKMEGKPVTQEAAQKSRKRL